MRVCICTWTMPARVKSVGWEGKRGKYRCKRRNNCALIWLPLLELPATGYGLGGPLLVNVIWPQYCMGCADFSHQCYKSTCADKTDTLTQVNWKSSSSATQQAIYFQIMLPTSHLCATCLDRTILSWMLLSERYKEAAGTTVLRWWGLLGQVSLSPAVQPHS